MIIVWSKRELDSEKSENERDEFQEFVMLVMEGKTGWL